MDALVKLAELFLSPKRNGFPILIALIGLAFAFFGYDLFRMGVQEGGAALDITYGENKSFKMGKGGPGLIFCAFGMGLIIYAIAKYDKLRVQPNPEIGIDSDGRTYEIDEDGNKNYR